VPEPVPTPLWSALTDAMGGWGPFTVREIAALFEDHGFEETGEAEPQQGVRRTEAAERLAPIDWSDASQRQRLLTLIDDVLEFYPETEEESPLSPGRRLRRALQRVSEGLPQVPAGETAAEATFAETTDSDDPFDIWPPGRIRLFFSHTSDQRLLVSRIASALEHWPFACFVAHEEIEPSLTWQEVIESGLRTCEALVAFVTSGFRTSAWCDQEVGWALGRGIVVIPVHLDADPHGLAGAIQAVPAALDDAPGEIAERIATALTTAVFRQTRPGAARLVDPVTDAIIDQFCASPTQTLARRRLDFLRRIPSTLWTTARRLRVDAAFETNPALSQGLTESGEEIPTVARSLWP
jgi:hypothetical protein